MNFKFPKYCRTPDEQVYYRIDSDSGFEEWRKLGARYLKTTMDAKDYMDGLYIQNLLAAIDDGSLERLTADEFQIFLKLN